MSTLPELINGGFVEECPDCGGLSSYEWEDANQQEGIMHMPSSSLFMWECGHCGTVNDNDESPSLRASWFSVNKRGPKYVG